MKKLTDAQLQGLRSRCIQAVARGYAIGQVDQYLGDLSKETGIADVPPGVKKGSAEHLQTIVQEAIDQRSGKKAKPAPKPAPKVEAKPAPKVEKAKAKEPAPKPAPEPEVKPYEEWSYEELYKETQVRDISGRSNKTKDELVEMLYENDNDA